MHPVDPESLVVPEVLGPNSFRKTEERKSVYTAVDFSKVFAMDASQPSKIINRYIPSSH